VFLLRDLTLSRLNIVATANLHRRQGPISQRVSLLRRLIKPRPFSGSMPDKVHCAHILVKAEAEAKAILEELRKGRASQSWPRRGL